jgi:hypothetical protein
VCATTPGCAGAGRDVTLSASIASVNRAESAMKNFVAPLSFTIAAAWVVILFVLVHSNA